MHKKLEDVKTMLKAHGKQILVVSGLALVAGVAYVASNYELVDKDNLYFEVKPETQRKMKTGGGYMIYDFPDGYFALQFHPNED